MISVNSGVVEFSIPARPLGISVSAVANKNAGNAFPQIPTISRNQIFFVLSSRMFFNASGKIKTAAKIIRSAPTWMPVNKSFPSGVNSPRFIKMKELPQIRARRIRSSQSFKGDGVGFFKPRS